MHTYINTDRETGKAYINAYIQADIRRQMHAYINTDMHTHIHAYIHTASNAMQKYREPYIQAVRQRDKHTDIQK